jgi:predicted transcriptional regulator
MSKQTPHPAALTTAQLEVMNVIWERGEATISEVWQELRKRRKIARPTVQTVITRLEEKGWLRHRPIGQTFMYTSVFSKEDVQGRMVGSLVDNAFGGSVEGLVWALLRNRDVSPAEARRIQTMIDESKRKRSKRSKRQ